MPSQAFGVTTTERSIPLTGDHVLRFTVSNQLDRQVRANAYVELFKDGEEVSGIRWITVDDPKTFDLAPDGSATVSVRIDVPDKLPADWTAARVSLQLFLVVSNVDDPDNERGKSVPITLHPDDDRVPPPPPPARKAIPWLYFAIGGGGVVLAVIVGLIVHFAGRSSSPRQLGEPCASEGKADSVCAAGLICGPELGRCVPARPETGDRCDPRGPRCPTGQICDQSSGSEPICLALLTEGTSCSTARDLCDPAQLVCGAASQVCVKKSPALGDLCDATSTASKCPPNSTCRDTTSGRRCTSNTRRVFVTSQIFDGNLGGLAGADQKCQSLAQAAGLGGTYRAWLSDSRQSPSTRFTKDDVPYVLVDGTQIAESFAELATRGLINPINKDERGRPAPASDPICDARTDWVMTGTQSAGTLTNADVTCINWSSTEGNGNWGRYTGLGSSWSSVCTGGAPASLCGKRTPIFCFEQ